MRRSAIEIVLSRSTINHVNHTVVSTRSRIDLCRSVVCRETSLPLIVDLIVNSCTGTSTCQTCRRNDTSLISVVYTERVADVILTLRDVECSVLCETSVEEATYVVISLRSSPSIQTCSGILRVVVLTLVQTVCSIIVLNVATVTRIVRQISDLRTPCRRRVGVVSSLAATLSIYILMLELAAQCLGTQVHREGYYRLLSSLATTLGCDQDHTVRGTDTIKGRSSLTLQHADVLNVIRVDINATVGEVSTCYRVTCREVRCRSDRHTIYNIQRCIVTVE